MAEGPGHEHVYNEFHEGLARKLLTEKVHPQFLWRKSIHVAPATHDRLMSTEARQHNCTHEDVDAEVRLVSLSATVGAPCVRFFVQLIYTQLLHLTSFLLFHMARQSKGFPLC